MAKSYQRDIVAIGASLGGIQALLELVTTLPRDLSATVFVSIHVAAGYVGRLPELVNARGPLRASYPVDGEAFEPGRIYIAPPDNHLLVRNGFMNVRRGPKENGHRPSIDVMFRSASAAYGARVIGVVLTGNLDCGTAGLLSIKARGGLSVVQDPRDAEAPSMPESALRHAHIDHVVTVRELGPLLARLTRETVELTDPHLSSAMQELEGDEPGLPSPLVCPVCLGSMTEAKVGSYDRFQCHVGHQFSLGSLVTEQAESVERALWAAVRSLEETAGLTRRLAECSTGDMQARFEEKELDQRQQADILKRLILSRQRLSTSDAPQAALLDRKPKPSDEAE